MSRLNKTVVQTRLVWRVTLPVSRSWCVLRGKSSGQSAYRRLVSSFKWMMGKQMLFLNPWIQKERIHDTIRFLSCFPPFELCDWMTATHRALAFVKGMTIPETVFKTWV